MGVFGERMALQTGEGFERLAEDDVSLSACHRHIALASDPDLVDEIERELAWIVIARCIR
jgi:hypothetical protein